MSAALLSPKRLGVACGVGAGALWGGVFLAPEYVTDASPALMAAGRYLAYGLMAGVLIAPRLGAVALRLDLTAWCGLVWLSLLGNLVYYGLLVVSVQLAGIAAAALIVGMVPVAVMVMGLREPGGPGFGLIAPPVVLAILAALLIGFTRMTDPSPAAQGDAIHVGLGLICAVGALICWSGFAVANSRWLARLPDVTAHDWSLLTGLVTGSLALLLVPLSLLSPPVEWGRSDWTRFAGISLAVAFGASILGNALWNKASRLLPLTLLGQMIVFETLFALLYGFLLEGRWPVPLEALAILLMMTSVTWSLRTYRPARSVETPRN